MSTCPVQDADIPDDLAQSAYFPFPARAFNFLNMSDKYILDERGEPVLCEDLIAWAQWYEIAENRQVGLTKLLVDDVPVAISTIFLGFDHGDVCVFGQDPLTYRPTLWETMIFGGASDQMMWRYTSLQAAKDGHEKAVQQASGEKVNI